MTKRNTRKPKAHYKSVFRLVFLFIFSLTMFSVGMGDPGRERSQEDDYFRKGNEFFEKKDFLEALVWYRMTYESTSNMPNSPLRTGALRGIWQCYEKLGDAEKAEEWKRLAERKTVIVVDLAQKRKALPTLGSDEPAKSIFTPPDETNVEEAPAAIPTQDDAQDGISLKATPMVNTAFEPAKMSNAQNKPIVVEELRVTSNYSGNPYCLMRDAIQSGNIDKVDELLSKGFDINTIMCQNLRFFFELRKEKEEIINTAQQERIWQYKGYDRYLWMVTGSGDWQWQDRTLKWQKWPSSIAIVGTPLMLACWTHNPVMVRHLLEKGANPNIWIKFKCKNNKDNFSRPWLSAYHYLSAFMLHADEFKRVSDKIAEINEMLLKAGPQFPAERDDFGRTALWDAFEIFDPFWLECLLKQTKEDTNEKMYDPNECDGGGDSFVDFIDRFDERVRANQPGPEKEFMLGRIQEMKKLLEKYGYKKPDPKGDGKDESGTGGYKFNEVK